MSERNLRASHGGMVEYEDAATGERLYRERMPTDGVLPGDRIVQEVRLRASDDGSGVFVTTPPDFHPDLGMDGHVFFDTLVEDLHGMRLRFTIEVLALEDK